MRRLLQAILLTFLLTGFVFVNAQKSIDAYRIDGPIEIDGMLNEAEWEASEIATDFITLRPKVGLSPEQKTRVRVLYDDEAIYIGASMDEVSRDSIMTQLTQRDDVGNTDIFGMILDTYGSGNDALEFVVGATGVQFDAAMMRDGNEDTNWDAVWFSGVHLHDKGWDCEIMIPYSAIRFPKQEEQVWRVNFFRRQSRTQVQGFWNPIDPKVSGFVNQSGLLKNIVDIKPPLRLSLSPYFSTYALHHHDPNASPVNSTGYSWNGGLDLKLGLTDAFTLDMTLIPDFGQVQSDEQVLNLSPFEIRFSENRPFFTEGTEIFNSGGIFYSRRVGGRPIGYGRAYESLGEHEVVTSNPETSRLYNATKISGRNRSGLGIGIFNAIGQHTEAVITDSLSGKQRRVVTAPLTNYNVLVFDQNLKNQSSLSLTNTNVWRKGNEFYEANVSNLSFDIRNNKQSYGLIGNVTLANQVYWDEEDNNSYKYFLGIRKISGNWRGLIYVNEESPTYDINDLGFIRSPNERSVSLEVAYRIFDPFWNFNQGNVWFEVDYSRLVDPNAFARLRFNTGFWVESKNFWDYNMWLNYRPQSYDYFEPRVQGRYYAMPAFGNAGFWVGTDNRKPFRMSMFGFAYKVDEVDRWGYEFGLNPRYRVSDSFTFYIDSGFDMNNNDVGFVDLGAHSEIYFGKRNRRTYTNTVGMFYNFTEKMGIDMRTRHYWSKVYYNSFFELGNEGQLLPTDFNAFQDLSYNSFTVDFVFNWRFAPGSDIFIVWKNNISGVTYDDNIDYKRRNYMDGVSSLGSFPQNNSLSLRVVYYLDYVQVKKWL